MLEVRCDRWINEVAGTRCARVTGHEGACVAVIERHEPIIIITGQSMHVWNYGPQKGQDNGER